jgi:hypothetical protein
MRQYSFQIDKNVKPLEHLMICGRDQRIEQGKGLAVLHHSALKKVGPTKQRAHVSIWVDVGDECSGILEAPLSVTVQKLLQPAVTDEKRQAANDA